MPKVHQCRKSREILRPSEKSSRSDIKQAFTVLLRLQAKNEVGHILHSVNEADSQVSRAAANIAAFKGSKFSKCFVEYRLHSWQAHLERISLFLLEGEGVWWKEFNGIYYFMDGDDDPNYHSHGPTLLHFRTASLNDVVTRQKNSWKQILDQFIPLPTQKVYTYDTDGNPTATRVFPTISTHMSAHSSNPTTMDDRGSLSYSSDSTDRGSLSHSSDTRDRGSRSHSSDSTDRGSLSHSSDRRDRGSLSHSSDTTDRGSLSHSSDTRDIGLLSHSSDSTDRGSLSHLSDTRDRGSLSHSSDSTDGGSLSLVRLHGRGVTLSLVRLHGRGSHSSDSMDRGSLSHSSDSTDRGSLSHSSDSTDRGSLSHLSDFTTMDSSGSPSSDTSGLTDISKSVCQFTLSFNQPLDNESSTMSFQYDHIQTPDIVNFDEEQQHLKTKLAKVLSKALGMDEIIKNTLTMYGMSSK